eukprot:m.1540143 g.1540143  ORF g.1540143 m.1540143 type:complete len:1683 (-) comp25247_c1_seq26:64-5112(-)
MADKSGAGTASRIAKSKLEAFSQGRMNITQKKTPFQLRKEEQEKKRKAEEQEAAKAYAEFVAHYSDSTASAKAFVRSETVHGKDVRPSTDSGGRKKLWKPDSELESKRSTPRSAPKPLKSSKTGKKMSNMELFMEQIKRNQEERDQRHAQKDTGAPPSLIPGIILPPPPTMGGGMLGMDPGAKSGSFDNGDPATTNLYVGNLSPQMNEGELCKHFGKYGPLASVKIMWPRTQEEKSRGRLCGFVAFMKRKDGQNCLDDLNGKEILGFEIKLGWGKAVKLPDTPFYVHAVCAAGMKIKTGLPFNAQPSVASMYESSGFGNDQFARQRNMEAQFATASVVVHYGTHTRTCTDIHPQRHTYLRIQMYIHTYMHIRALTHVHTRRPTHTRAHTDLLRKNWAHSGAHTHAHNVCGQIACDTHMQVDGCSARWMARATINLSPAVRRTQRQGLLHTRVVPLIATSIVGSTAHEPIDPAMQSPLEKTRSIMNQLIPLACIQEVLCLLDEHNPAAWQVVIPNDKVVRQLIHRTVEFVIREGPEFEALLMQRVAGDAKFNFLFANDTFEHTYYRWKLFSILQGDRTDRWAAEPFRMFLHGPVWEPPDEDQLKFTAEDVEKGHLSSDNRDRLEDLLRGLTPERKDIAKAMVFCIMHADAAAEIVDCISESLQILETPIHTKVARLFLVSDILHNCSASVKNASFYRSGFEAKLKDIFTALNATFKAISGRLRAEQFRKNVFGCLNAWRDWNVYAPNVFEALENLFNFGTTDPTVAMRTPGGTSASTLTAAGAKEGQARDGGAMFGDSDDDDDDVDGVPLTLGAAAATATTTTKDVGAADIFGNDDDDDEDVDGTPLNAPVTAAGAAKGHGKRVSKWEMLDDDDDDDDSSLKHPAAQLSFRVPRSTSGDCEYMELHPSPSAPTNEVPDTIATSPDATQQLLPRNSHAFPRRRNSGWDDCDLAMMVSRTTSRTRKHVIVDHTAPLPVADEEGPGTTPPRDGKHPDLVLPPLESTGVQLHADDNANVVHQLLTNQAALDRVRIRRARDQTNKKRRMPTRHAATHAPHSPAPPQTPTAALPSPAPSKGHDPPPKRGSPGHPDVRRKGKRSGKFSKAMIGSPEPASFEHVVSGTPHRPPPATAPIQALQSAQPAPPGSNSQKTHRALKDTDSATCNYAAVDLPPSNKSPQEIREARANESVLYTTIDSLATERMGSDDRTLPPLPPKRSKSTKSLDALHLIADLEHTTAPTPAEVAPSPAAKPEAVTPAAAPIATSQTPTTPATVSTAGQEAGDDGSLVQLCTEKRLPAASVVPSLQAIGIHIAADLRGVSEEQLVKNAGLKVGHARKLLAGVPPWDSQTGSPAATTDTHSPAERNTPEGKFITTPAAERTTPKFPLEGPGNTDDAVCTETSTNTVMDGVTVETLKWEHSHQATSTTNLPFYTMRILNSTATPVRVTVDTAESHNIAWADGHGDDTVNTVDVPVSDVHVDIGTLRVIANDPFAVTWQLANRFTCTVLGSDDAQAVTPATTLPGTEETTAAAGEPAIAATAQGATSEAHVSKIDQPCVSKLDQPKRSGGLVSRLFGFGKKRRGQHTLANTDVGAKTADTPQTTTHGTPTTTKVGPGAEIADAALADGVPSGDGGEDDTVAPLRADLVTMMGDVSGMPSATDDGAAQPIYRVPSVSKSNPLFRESMTQL